MLIGVAGPRGCSTREGRHSGGRSLVGSREGVVGGPALGLARWAGRRFYIETVTMSVMCLFFFSPLFYQWRRTKRTTCRSTSMTTYGAHFVYVVAVHLSIGSHGCQVACGAAAAL